MGSSSDAVQSTTWCNNPNVKCQPAPEFLFSTDCGSTYDSALQAAHVVLLVEHCWYISQIRVMTELLDGWVNPSCSPRQSFALFLSCFRTPGPQDSASRFGCGCTIVGVNRSSRSFANVTRNILHGFHRVNHLPCMCGSPWIWVLASPTLLLESRRPNFFIV